MKRTFELSPEMGTRGHPRHLIPKVTNYTHDHIGLSPISILYLLLCVIMLKPLLHSLKMEDCFISLFVHEEIDTIRSLYCPPQFTLHIFQTWLSCIRNTIIEHTHCTLSLLIFCIACRNQ